MADYEEMRKIFNDLNIKSKEKAERDEMERMKELKEKGEEPFDSSKFPEKRCDHPSTMENSTATVMWIVAMIVGAIFKGKLIIWMIATAVWLKFITRYK